MSQKQNPTTTPQHRDDIDVGRLVGLLLDYKLLIAGLTAAFAVAGAAYALLSIPIYKADALVQIEAARSMNPLDEVTSLLGKEPPSRSEIEIIRSRMVLGRAVDILSLDVRVEPQRLPVLGNFLTRIGIERPAIAQGWGYTWAGEIISLESLRVNDGYLGHSFTLQVLSPESYALFYDGEKLGEGNVGAAAEFMGGDVSVTVDAIQAPAGAEFSLSHMRRLVAISKLRNSLRITEQGRDTGILSWEITNEDPVMAETLLRTIADIYVAQNVQRQSEEARKSLEFLNEQLPSVKAILTEAEEKLNTYRSDRHSVDLTLQTEAVLTRLVNIEAQLNELDFSEAEISRRFTRTHPTYAALLDKKAQLRKEQANIEAKINDLPETQQEILRLQRDLAVNQEIYVQLLNKVQEMQIAEASTVGNVRVLDGAEAFPTPVEPNKPLIVLLSALLGSTTGVGLVLVRSLFRRGVENQDQLESLGLSVYATIPLSEEQQKFARRNRHRRTKARHAAGLLAQRNPADASVEALRGLRTSLHFGMMEGKNKCIMITGPSPGIGKSFVSANLAAVCAQMGQRVLVIDGDMRKGHLHTLFGDTPKGGLSEFLTGSLALKDVVRNLDELENLQYISRGTAPPNPAELLTRGKFATLLAAVDKHYDTVIIDSPPILAVTDAAIIGKHVGTSLVVARFQLNPPKEIELAVRRLETAGVEVSGAILNAVERTAAGAYGYGYYSYSYQ